MAEELEDLWKNLKLTEEENDGIEPSEGNCSSDRSDEQMWLVGKLHTKRSFNKDALMGMLKQIWKLIKPVDIVCLEENFFLLKFSLAAEMNRVLDGSPWAFDKQLIMLKEFNDKLKPSEYMFNTASFWVRVYELPLGLRNQENAVRIGNKIGVLKVVDASLEQGGWARFLRIRVEVDVTRPLRRAVKIVGTNGKEIWGRLSYERLPSFCYECGMLGHTDSEYEDEKSQGNEKHGTQQYGH
ncbi:hypothetical protein PTKIN_Ptkin11bG0121000 [Pterospermum kingtungense]